MHNALGAGPGKSVDDVVENLVNLLRVSEGARDKRETDRSDAKVPIVGTAEDEEGDAGGPGRIEGETGEVVDLRLEGITLFSGAFGGHEGCGAGDEELADNGVSRVVESAAHVSKFGGEVEFRGTVRGINESDRYEEGEDSGDVGFGVLNDLDGLALLFFQRHNDVVFHVREDPCEVATSVLCSCHLDKVVINLAKVLISSELSKSLLSIVFDPRPLSR